jgi:predicted nucleotidyltransferase
MRHYWHLSTFFVCARAWFTGDISVAVTRSLCYPLDHRKRLMGSLVPGEMMHITSEKMQTVVDVLRSMGARTVVLFGSMVDAPEMARDVDIAVEGIPLTRILDADVAVHDLLGVPTDLVSHEENPAFFDVVKDYGRILFQAA